MTDRRLDDRLLSAAEREADGLAPREDLAELLMEARAELRRLRSLFSAKDALRLEWAASFIDGSPVATEFTRERTAEIRDIAARIRQARGEPSA
jgi:hypothetical protein